MAAIENRQLLPPNYYIYCNGNPISYMDPSGNMAEVIGKLLDAGDYLYIIKIMIETGYGAIKKATPLGIGTSIVFTPSKAGETDEDLKNDVEFQKFLSGGGTGDPNKNNKKDKGSGKVNLNVKPEASNQKLKNIIDNLYKGQNNPNKIGNGTTMDAIRAELQTGSPTGGKFHTTKGLESINGLNNLLNSGNLPPGDANIARELIRDLTNALAGK